MAALLELELPALLGGDQRSRIVARYFGLDGLGGTTLHIAGSEAGITAERVRQLVNIVTQRLTGQRPAAEALDRALAFVARRVPAWAGDIEPELQAQGISATSFRIEGLLRAADLFGRTAPFSLTVTPRGRLVHAGSVQSLDTVVRTAHRAMERRGVTTIAALLTELREIEPKSADRRLVSHLLSGVGEFCWLDASHTWFWLPGVPRNPVVRRIRKVLSVSNPVAIGELYSGVAREYQAGAAPPEHVILELCRQIPGLEVDGNAISSPAPIDRTEALSGVETIIVDALAGKTKAVRCADLVALCLARGINRSSFYSSLSHSPVILPCRSGMMRLVGSPDTTIDAIPAPRRPHARLGQSKIQTLRCGPGHRGFRVAPSAPVESGELNS